MAAFTKHGPSVNDYALVHIVSQEMTKDLIGSQVIDHMQWQATAQGDGRPTTTTVVFVEPARKLFHRQTWRRRAELAKRAPSVRIAVLPIVGRMSVAANARILRYSLRRLVGSRRVVFHCRGEAAGVWAHAIRAQLEAGGVVVDVRGARPEELLFERGYDGPAKADGNALRGYELSLERLRSVLDHAGAILTVSDRLASWLTGLGLNGKPIAVVPCCVVGCAYDSEQRRAARERLGLSQKLVLAYVGTVTSYQHVEDGALRFVADALRMNPAVHLLGLTNEPSRMIDAALRLGIPLDDMTVRKVRQENVAAVLMAADAGLLLRESSRMNRVSMPVKLGEYLSCGVPIIVSRMDGWVDELIEENEAGIAINWFEESDEERKETVSSALTILCSRGARLREGAVALCRERFTWSRYTQDVRNAYLHALGTE